MRTLSLEVRYAVRSILKRPAMSAIVVVTLALGIGANAAVFSMIDALVLRPFTMPDADRITLLSSPSADDVDPPEAVSPADFLDMKRQQPDAFERLAAFELWNANLVGQDEPENVQGFFVSADFFPALGVQPVAGRTFLPEEETRGRHRRVVLGHGLWQRRFASDRVDRRPRHRSGRRRQTKSSASRRRASISRWGRRSGRRCRSRPRLRPTAVPST